MFGKKRRSLRLVEQVEPILGTLLEVQIVAESEQEARRAFESGLGEIDRLERVFSRYMPESELARFDRTVGEWVEVSEEFMEVLALAEIWRVRTGGAFHPCTEAIKQAWEQDGMTEDLVEQMANDPFALDTVRGRAQKLVDLPINLNAVAKGFIVDRACEVAFRAGCVSMAMVNVGGDIRHIGEPGVAVEVADPRHAFDNEEPLATVQLENGGLATSGVSHRTVKTAKGEIAHVFDARTGEPVKYWAGMTVVAESTALADLLATALMVMTEEEAVNLERFQDSSKPYAWMSVTLDGIHHFSHEWPRVTA